VERIALAVTRRRYDAEAEATAPPVVDAEVRIDSAQARHLSVAFGLLTVLGVGWWVATTDVDWWVVPVRAGLIGALSGVAAYIVLFGLFVRDERQDRKRARHFLALRDEMMARGLLRWKNPEHHLSGYVFRAGFDEALAYIASYEMEG